MSTTLRVLLVEDSAEDAELLLRKVRRAGFDVACTRVQDRDALREALARQAWDLVISDFYLPDLDGSAVLGMYTESGLDAPFILVSSSVGEETAVQIMRAGAHDYVMKDELGRLPGAIERELRAAEARRERRRAEEQVTRQMETIAALYAGAQNLTQSLDVESLARDIVRTYVHAFGARLAWLGRAEADGSIRALAVYPDPGASSGVPSPRWDDSPEGQGPSGRAIRSGFPVVIENLAEDPALDPWRSYLQSTGVRSAAAFPLISRRRPFGAVAVLADDPDFFTPGLLELFQGYANQAAGALENARLFEETERRVRQLSALRTIDMAITASLDLRVTLNVILDQVTTQLKVDAANILLYNPTAQTLEYGLNRGFRTKALQHASLRRGEGHAGRAMLEGRMIHIANLAEDPGEFTRSPFLHEEQFVTYCAAPLVAKGQVDGMLELFHRSPLDPDPEWLAFLEALAGQAAIAIDNAGLFEDLQRSNADLMLAYETTLEGWSRALDLRDKETEGHTQRVAELTIWLARAVGMRGEDLVHIRRGALLHDIGKMGIPDSILLKPGPLTDQEWEIMRRHPVYAYEMLSPIPYLRPALDIPYCHHEKWDGTGYPRGLKGEQIPLAARIFAVVDVWDALTSDRPYRPAWSAEQARAHIQTQAGAHFDPRVVDAFMSLDAVEPATPHV